MDEKYGFAIVDGMKEKIAGYMIEAPTLFKGRGEHPKAGCMKARIFPEDIIINCASNAQYQNVNCRDIVGKMLT